MNLLQYYYKTIIKYDLINKFHYTKTDEIPKLKKIILNFGCKQNELKNLAASMLALELITTKQGIITKSRKPNILLKIRKGNPIGCLVILKKEKMYTFFLKLLNDIFPALRDFNGLFTKKNFNSFSFTLTQLITFSELENQFYLFSKLPPLNITFVTNTKTKKELVYLLKSFKLPLI